MCSRTGSCRTRGGELPHGASGVIWRVVSGQGGEHEYDSTLVCVVEIPKGGRNKYEYEPRLGGIKFDRLLMSAATYPTDYGYLRGTLGQDGDPLDALVCLSEPTFPGCLIPVKPVGLFKMRDEKGVDDKIVAVSVRDPWFADYTSREQLPAHVLRQLRRFFEDYKILEHKQVVVEDLLGVEEALDIIRDALEMYRRLRRGDIRGHS